MSLRDHLRTPSSKRTVNSCLRCRHRKIRCGRERPQCLKCIRAGQVCEYLSSAATTTTTINPDVYITADDEHTFEARGSPGSQGTSTAGHLDGLPDRVGRLELLVSRLMAKDLQSPNHDGYEERRIDKHLPTISDTADTSLSKLGDLLIIDSKPRHVVGSYWKQLAAQHHDLESLLDSSDSDDDERNVERKRSLLTPTLFASPDPTFHPQNYMPNFQEAGRIYTLFRNRVDPIARLLHKPSFEAEMKSYYMRSPSPDGSPAESVGDETSDRRGRAGFEAFLFAIFYSALFSLSEDEFLAFIHLEMGVTQLSNGHGRPTKDLYLRIFQWATEQSLLRSGLLKKPTVNSVSALCLLMYISCDEAEAEDLHSLTGVLMRLARSLSLHIDPEALVLINKTKRSAGNESNAISTIVNSVDVEKRRRLWHLILHLDLMVSEAHGSDPEPVPLELWPSTVATALPKNIDDIEVFPGLESMLNELTGLPDDRGRVTEMTMQLIRLNTSLCLRHTSSLPLKVQDLRVYDASTGLRVATEIEARIDEAIQRNEKLYLRYCNKDNPLQNMSLTLGKMAEYKARLNFYYRFQKDNQDQNSQQSWDPPRRRALVAAADLIHSFQALLENPGTAPFRWHIQRRAQVHAMLHLLNELSSVELANMDPEMQQICFQAWSAIESVSMKIDRSAGSGSATDRLWEFLRQLRNQVRQRMGITQVDETNNSNNNNNDNDNNNNNTSNTNPIDNAVPPVSLAEFYNMPLTAEFDSFLTNPGLEFGIGMDSNDFFKPM